jgi:hypothetical protein
MATTQGEKARFQCLDYEWTTVGYNGVQTEDSEVQRSTSGAQVGHKRSTAEFAESRFFPVPTTTSQEMNNNATAVGVKDKHGNLDLNAPNPVNPNPQYNGDYPKPNLGPYYHFITTDLNQMLWIGSALIFRHISFGRPKIKFSCEPKLDFNWDILYDNLCGMRIYRINISIELRNGEGDDKINWKINWGDHKTEGSFHIARYNQKWRGGFFSCNGFDASVSEEKRSKLKLDKVWKHLTSIHAQTPLHLLIWGGDQCYIDNIFEDIPYLRKWVKMEWNIKWTCDFHDHLKEQIEQYYFNTYLEAWELPETKKALASVPSLMMWDDHDIFDGAGSYPRLLHDSPMMSGLFKTALKMRLLFQHHTTLEKARDHGLFGYQGYNSFTHCGPNLAIVGADGRSERNTETIQHHKSWDMIFEKLENHIGNISHLIVVFPVPFSYLRFKLAESIFERLKNLPNKYRNLPIVKQTNSIFGLPELYDDLLDEWTHEAHINERNHALERFQNISQKKKVRITFFSGDVHCCGISRFKTLTRNDLAPIHDTKLMYQIISSAIVNHPPSRMAIRAAHFGTTKWYPIEDTVEELIEFFQRSPETRGRLILKKLLPNRNWCYFEQCQDIDPSNYSNIETGCFHCRFGPKKQTSNVNELNPISTIYRQVGMHTLKIRLWLENGDKHNEGREFVHYDLLIPNII